MSARERAGAAGEFLQAKHHCFMVLSNKLAPWTQLPWKLCGLAHFDPSRVAQTTQAVLQLFD
eukprot:8327961-Alexandrium_andersonii.AAC.1